MTNKNTLLSSVNLTFPLFQELQKLVADERGEKDKLQHEVAALKAKIIVLEDPSKVRVAESHISKLKEDLENAKMQLVVKVNTVF